MIKSVCVYCASSDNINIVYNDAAKKLGQLLGKRNIRIINGAGKFGLMRAVSDGALSVGGKVTGVIPEFMVDNGWCHPNLTEIIKTQTMHERKQTMANLSDAAIALPGGYGTFEEMLEFITWRQLSLHDKPIIILNTNHYYDPLLEMFQKAKEEDFMRSTKPLWEAADTPEEVVEKLLTIMS